MELSEFINKNLGKKVDFDGANGPTCVDLFRAYNRDVNGYPRTEALGADGGAKDLYLRYNEFPIESMYYARFNAEPACGDIVVFDGHRGNKYGHVAIYISTLSNGKLLVFEQDGIKQDGAKFAIWDTKRVLGYLAPKL